MKRTPLIILSVLGVATPVLLWMRANSLTSVQDKEAQQEWLQFTSRYPKTSKNDSAVKLESLVAQLELNQKFSEISEDLRKSLPQLTKPYDSVDLPPERLRRYLAAYAPQLSAIRSHVLKSDLPQWELDFNQYLDPSSFRPNFFDIVTVQKLLAVEILEKNRIGQTQAVLENLEVSWKLNQALLNRPDLVSQLIAIIVVKFQAEVIRKIDALPPQWQQRLLEHNYSSSVLTASEIESFAVAQTIREANSVADLTSVLGVDKNPIKQILALPLKPYLRLSANDFLQKSRQQAQRLSQQDICSFLNSSNKQPNANEISRWNVPGQLATLSLSRQWLKAERLMLELELTQQVQWMKALTKSGKFPRLVPPLESRECPSEKWIYQLSPDGRRLSISYSQKIDLPEPYPGTHQNVVPFTYSIDKPS